MVEIACIIITITTLAYALHKIGERRKLEAFLRSEAWYLYAKSSNTLAQFEKAIDLYKRRNTGHVDPDLIEHMAKSQAFGQDLIRETIRLIQLAEPRFDVETVRQWSAEKKLSLENHGALFEILTVQAEEKPGRWIKSSRAPAPENHETPARPAPQEAPSPPKQVSSG